MSPALLVLLGVLAHLGALLKPTLSPFGDELARRRLDDEERVLGPLVLGLLDQLVDRARLAHEDPGLLLLVVCHIGIVTIGIGGDDPRRWSLCPTTSRGRPRRGWVASALCGRLFALAR